MEEVKVCDKCPFCGCTEFVKGKQEGYASIGPADRILTFKNQTLYHVICMRCGSVVKSYVSNPEKLVSKNNVIN